MSRYTTLSKMEIEIPVTKTRKFRSWFAGSKVKDGVGNPIVCYHGSKSVINEFDFKYTGQGNDQIGSGFYFTTDRDEARAYGGNIHECYLAITKPLDADKVGSVSKDAIRRIIMKAPNLEDGLSNWGDVSYEGRESVIRRAIENYEIRGENIVKGLFNLANDFYDGEVKAFNSRIHLTLGYDGVVKHHQGKTHYVAFFPYQIKATTSRNFDQESNNIYASTVSSISL